MTEESKQAISFTDIKGKTYEISDKELCDTDIRFDLSIRFYKEVKLVDGNGNEKIIKAGNCDPKTMLGKDKSVVANTRLEYHIDMVNSYFDDIEKTFVISKDEFNRLLNYLQEQETTNNDESNQEDPEIPEVPEKPTEDLEPEETVPEDKKVTKKTTKKITKKVAKSAKKK